MKLLKKHNDDKLIRKYCSAVIVGAGASQRMEGLNKLMLPLGGVPVLCRSLLQYENCEAVDEIIVVTKEDDIAAVGRLCCDYGITKAVKIIKGGKTRPESVMAGINEISRDAELVAIHDAARPLVTGRVILSAIDIAGKTGAAIPAVPLKDTVKSARSGVVFDTPERELLFAVQTPQVFDPAIISAALTKALAEGWNITDDASAVERMGMSVHLTEGSEENIKITTKVDILLAEAILSGRNA